MLLTSCGQVKKYEELIEDDSYVYVMRYHDNFNVLQLTDIHWNANTSTIASKRYLDKVLKEVDRKIKAEQGNGAIIDLIEITGDQFMLANAFHVQSFLSYFEQKAVEYGFLYTAIWGNHDRHGLYNPNWLSAQFKKAKHCIYIEPEDNLYGRSNFVINLAEGDDFKTTTKWQLANLDSGASFSETAISPFRDYDYIRDDQVKWWKAEHDKVGASVPTIAYYHIPQQDNLEAWNMIHDENDPAQFKSKFFKLEEFADNGNPEYASNFIATGRATNLKRGFMGHAHNVDWTVDYNGVVIGLGVKTGPELYYAHVDANSTNPATVEGYNSISFHENFDLIGASLVTIKDESNFDLEHLYLNERANDDFISWEKW